MTDFELQELVLDWMYMLWRGWSKRSTADGEIRTKALESTLHPKLHDCMLQTCA